MKSPIEPNLNIAIRLAQTRCGGAAPMPPMLLLEGRQGEAVLNLNFATAAERARLAAKARLMATALEARACACIFETALQVPGRRDLPVVVVVTAPRGGGGGVAVLARDRTQGPPLLTRLETGLAGQRIAGTLAEFLDAVLPQDPSERDVRLAWQQLEYMGINISSSGRALH